MRTNECMQLIFRSEYKHSHKTLAHSYYIQWENFFSCWSFAILLPMWILIVESLYLIWFVDEFSKWTVWRYWVCTLAVSMENGRFSKQIKAICSKREREFGEILVNWRTTNILIERLAIMFCHHKSYNNIQKLMNLVQCNPNI